jgi:drug/metabolite transporter (DMT)-like permease
VYWDDVALVLLAAASVGGLSLFGLSIAKTRGREQRIPAGLIAMHLSLGLLGLLVWFTWVIADDDPELGDARWFGLAVIVAAALTGVAQVVQYREARRQDSYGDRYTESAIKPLHVTGHVLVGTAALVLVVIACLTA